MELSSIGEQVFAVESITKKRIRKRRAAVRKPRSPAVNDVSLQKETENVEKEKNIPTLLFLCGGPDVLQFNGRKIETGNVEYLLKWQGWSPESMSTDVEQVFRRPARRRIRQRVAKAFPKHSSNKPIHEQKMRVEPVEKDWGGTSEEDKPGCESTIEERCEDSSKSDWGEAKGEEVCSECPKVENKNATSVIVRVQGCGKTMGDAVSVCSNSELKKDEVRRDSQSVIVTALDRPKVPTEALRPEKVIVTKVTVNCLTVTFQEARGAEGFFTGC
ncbi:hypothetical protein XENOCAPTIV_027768 [Xenoophorus captivus]|uniref:Uncharacterized protein n=1 Tax=Xenoophorus captivus TaxID=1517983 RepID=A0ABV0RVL1_9TELE